MTAAADMGRNPAPGSHLAGQGLHDDVGLGPITVIGDGQARQHEAVVGHRPQRMDGPGNARATRRASAGLRAVVLRGGPGRPWPVPASLRSRLIAVANPAWRLADWPPSPGVQAAMEEKFLRNEQGPGAGRLVGAAAKETPELTAALRSYVDRINLNPDDAPLQLGTGKELDEATARHVLKELLGDYSMTDNFPVTLTSAFTAVGFPTPTELPKLDPDPHRAVHQCLFHNVTNPRQSRRLSIRAL
jgi:hypothetical protein